MARRWELRAASDDDREPIAELRAVVLRADLERLGRFDERRVRQRFRDAFDPQHTRVIEVDGVFAGSVALRPDAEGMWLEHFYLDPRFQGAGIGTAVVSELLRAVECAVRLIVLVESPAQRLYARLGFSTVEQGSIDVIMERRPSEHRMA